MRRRVRAAVCGLYQACFYYTQGSPSAPGTQDGRALSYSSTSWELDITGSCYVASIVTLGTAYKSHLHRRRIIEFHHYSSPVGQGVDSENDDFHAIYFVRLYAKACIRG